MVQDELLRMRVQFQAGGLLAFEAAVVFNEAQRNPETRVWLRLATAMAKYLTAEYAIAAARAALELIGETAIPVTIPWRACCGMHRCSQCGRARPTSRH